MGLLSGDYSQIEARVLVCWARQEDTIEAFRQKKDAYKLMASRIYSKPMEQINSDERFMGKQGVLSCGFGVGKFGFQNNLKVQFDIEVTEEYADMVVKAYRAASPRVVALWDNVDKLAKRVLLERPTRFVTLPGVDKIHMRMYDKWLLMRLPSGRCLWYFEPELKMGERGLRIVYWGRDVKRGGMWTRVDTYGGKLVENGVQAMARDVMAEGMLRLDAAGFQVFMQVHDEVVAPGTEDQLEQFQALMQQRPTWWPDLPLDVEVQHETRYQK